MTYTIISHLACGEPIYVVRGGLQSGDLIEAHRFEPLNPEWPQPRSGDATICPACGRSFLPRDEELQRVHVEAW